MDRRQVGNDEGIIREVLAGDRERFALLVDRHGPALLGFLARRTTPENARELLQETLVQTFEGLGRLDDPERLRAWMISIAHNLLRKSRRRPAPLSLDALARLDGAARNEVALAEPAAAEVDALESAEERERLERAFDKLPARQREVFELRALLGLSHAEIARTLGIREENARANYYQALRRLRVELEEEP